MFLEEKIRINSKIVVSIENKNVLEMKGPLGNNTMIVNKFLQVEVIDNTLTVTTETKFKNYLNQFVTVFNNNVKGLLYGYYQVLEMKGIGYRFTLKNDELLLKIGFNKDVIFTIPERLTVKQINLTTICLQSTNYNLLQETTSKIRSLKKPDAYKGKGILFKGEVVKLKEVKK
jgi:large subunit ribosomal protein L6